MALSESEIRRRLCKGEDQFVERKRGVQSDETRKTLVAFANSVPEGEHAILFLGIDDKGNFTGVTGTDSIQKTIRNIAKNDCYPPIKCTSVVLQESGKTVVAVVVESSKDKPHFAGPAYVRSGSESVKASPELYEDLDCVSQRQGQKDNCGEGQSSLLGVEETEGCSQSVVSDFSIRGLHTSESKRISNY